MWSRNIWGSWWGLFESRGLLLSLHGFCCPSWWKQQPYCPGLTGTPFVYLALPSRAQAHSVLVGWANACFHWRSQSVPLYVITAVETSSENSIFIVRPLFWLNIVLCFLVLVCMYVQIHVYISNKVKLLFNFINVIKNKNKCIIISENERNISILAL